MRTYLVEVEIDVHAADGLVALVLLDVGLIPAAERNKAAEARASAIPRGPPELTGSAAVPLAEDLAPAVVVGVGAAELCAEETLRGLVKLSVESTVETVVTEPVLGYNDNVNLRSQIKQKSSKILFSFSLFFCFNEQK